MAFSVEINAFIAKIGRLFQPYICLSRLLATSIVAVRKISDESINDPFMFVNITLAITDTGPGKTRSELIEIFTKLRPGVNFEILAAFMIADKIKIVTKNNACNEQLACVASCGGFFTISPDAWSWDKSRA
jgi:hypothetical protein